MYRSVKLQIILEVCNKNEYFVFQPVNVMKMVQMTYNVRLQLVFVNANPDTKGINVILNAIVMEPVLTVKDVINLRVSVLAKMVILAPHVMHKPQQVRLLHFPQLSKRIIFCPFFNFLNERASHGHTSFKTRF